MKPSQVGFDGSFVVKAGNNTPKIRLARSMNEDKGPDGKITNTFIWWGKSEPELFYRSKDGKLYTVNFEPFGE